MYSNKENINILTSLLIEWGVSDAVVCPGSRNAAIVHNLNEADSIHCHPVTDERSAAFMALGIALATGKPTVVCVTSGTALLNTAPAVAEAFYQHIPLVVVAADRPKQWIGQLDGQTLPQPDALGSFVRRAVSLPEPHDDEERWFCSRLVNEALHFATIERPAPVLINVPISEPLFDFSVATLPETHKLNMMNSNCCLCPTAMEDLRHKLANARRPLFVVGQMASDLQECQKIDIAELTNHFVVFAEPLAYQAEYSIHFDEAVRYICSHQEIQEQYAPDYIIYIGDTIVSKPARRWLRQTKAPSCLVTTNAFDVHDPIMTLQDLLVCSYENVGDLLHELCSTESTQDKPFLEEWRSLLDRCSSHAAAFEPAYSQMAVVKYFEEQLDDLYLDVHTHYANSSAIRLASIYARHYVWCNRGVNGIEGSLSTAAGFSLGDDGLTVCIIGDLSFFYDQNALWNRCIGGNLRILLLNNGEGGIFRQLPGLDGSPATHDYVSAAHHTTAQGICSQNDIGYLSAHNMEEAQIGIVTLLTRQTQRPMLLEVFTSPEDDVKTLKDYFSYFRV